MKIEFQNSIRRFIFWAIYLKSKLVGQIPANDEMNFIKYKYQTLSCVCVCVCGVGEGGRRSCPGCLNKKSLTLAH